MLKLLNVVVDIAGIGVLRGISADFKSGETYAILGRNGAGKTTLLRTLMGFTAVRSGSIHLGGTDLLAEPPHTRAAHGIEIGRASCRERV